MDQLGTLILLSGGPEGRNAALDGAASFWLNAGTTWRGLPFWDEHSLDQQRFFSIICWVYGSNPGEYQALVQAWGLPLDRAAKCPAEYARMSKSWVTLLSPHIR